MLHEWSVQNFLWWLHVTNLIAPCNLEQNGPRVKKVGKKERTVKERMKKYAWRKLWNLTDAS